MEKAETYQEQRRIQSIFLQSLCRLHRLNTPALDFDIIEVYILLDWVNGALRDADTMKHKEYEEQLKYIHQYPAWVNGHAHFRKAHTKESSATLLTDLFTWQTHFFCQLPSDATLQSHVSDIVSLDRLRIQLLVQKPGIRSETSPSTAGDLINPEMRNTLQPTGWQTQYILGGACPAVVFTDVQMQILHEEPLPNNMH